MSGADITLVAEALAGDPVAVRRLVDATTPIVQARVARVLLRGNAGARDVRQEVEDFAQDVFVTLFRERGRLLRAWDPDKGLSLANYVGLIAERRTLSALRSRRRNPWSEDPAEPETLGRRAGGGPGFEPRVMQQDLLRAVLHRLRSGLSDKGRHLFELLMVEQRPIEEICAETGMTAAALYAWRSRLAKQAREIHEALMREGDDPAPGGAR